jgi:hypothetical protein
MTGLAILFGSAWVTYYLKEIVKALNDIKDKL